MPIICCSAPNTYLSNTDCGEWSSFIPVDNKIHYIHHSYIMIGIEIAFNKECYLSY
jgi:fatty acid desaturase